MSILMNEVSFSLLSANMMYLYSGLEEIERLEGVSLFQCLRNISLKQQSVTVHSSNMSFIKWWNFADGINLHVE